MLTNYKKVYKFLEDLGLEGDILNPPIDDNLRIMLDDCDEFEIKPRFDNINFKIYFGTLGTATYLNGAV